jgi:hypothetical protein
MTAKTRGRRSVDVLAMIDVLAYTPLVEQALKAFSKDTAYSIDMAKAAATIESKRKVWRDRLKDRKVEENSDVYLSS